MVLSVFTNSKTAYFIRLCHSRSDHLYAVGLEEKLASRSTYTFRVGGCSDCPIAIDRNSGMGDVLVRVKENRRKGDVVARWRLPKPNGQYSDAEEAEEYHILERMSMLPIRA